MLRHEKEIEYQVYQMLLDQFKERNSKLKLVSQDVWETPILRRRFDIVIYADANPIAVVEVKTRIRDNKNLLARATDQVRSALSITKARFGVVTDGNIFYFFDRNRREEDFREVQLNIIINSLVDIPEVKITQEDKNNVVRILQDALKTHLSDSKELREFLAEGRLRSNVKFDKKSSVYHFTDDSGLDAFENQMYQKMFGKFEEKEICRYTSLNTLFSMLNYISFRMSGLVGMNDKTEVNYVETYLSGGVERPLSKAHHNTVSAVINRYITSCSSIDKVDDLTLWRLYADDSKGVCLVFDTRLSNLNSYILLQKVKYADANHIHPELEFLKMIKDEVERITGFQFEFRKLGYWKHFFKPYDYSVEEEIRLLIIDNPNLAKIKNDWVMTYTHSIFNPIIDFQLNSKAFPLQLKEIILGPKCPESDINKVQIEEMIRRKRTEAQNRNLDSNFRRMQVELSKINHYR
jgi:hypothetical protein